MRRAAALGVVALMLVAVGGCGDNKPKPLPDSAGSGASSPSAMPTETAQDEYQAALARWTTYEHVSEPIWAAGKYTPKAKKLLARYWSSTGPVKVPATYQKVADAKLRQYAANGVQVKGLPTVLSSKAKTAQSHRVVIEQCVNYAPMKTFQHGKVVPPEAGPRRRTIVLSRALRGSPWMIESLDAATQGRSPCGG